MNRTICILAIPCLLCYARDCGVDSLACSSTQDDVTSLLQVERAVQSGKQQMPLWKLKKSKAEIPYWKFQLQQHKQFMKDVTKNKKAGLDEFLSEKRAKRNMLDKYYDNKKAHKEEWFKKNMPELVASAEEKSVDYGEKILKGLKKTIKKEEEKEKEKNNEKKDGEKQEDKEEKQEDKKKTSKMVEAFNMFYKNKGHDTQHAQLLEANEAELGARPEEDHGRKNLEQMRQDWEQRTGKDADLSKSKPRSLDSMEPVQFLMTEEDEPRSDGKQTDYDESINLMAQQVVKVLEEEGLTELEAPKQQVKKRIGELVKLLD